MHIICFSIFKGRMLEMVWQRKISDKYSHLNHLESRFSNDSEWIKRCVLIAKHTHVWMAQISERLDKKIQKLDDIPDEILEELTQQGFNALWLVGLWKRSKISRSIKRNLGLKHSEASAYSIINYQIADDIGGHKAFKKFKKRAARFGLRICADFVPNHTAIDADLMFEHSDFYLSSSENPFSQYSFSGINLSSNLRQEIYLEDHYMDQSDAAVVFKRVDGVSNEVRYFFHGNDGIDTPWNDTAQLDFSNHELRNRIIDELILLANRFPILRVDAAMLQISQHIQRLWFPQKQNEDSIPSRSEKNISAKEFEEMIPEEFWFEALRRLNEEAPDTLLLAEVYWTMESYFAHSIGMPRIYNIDFMRSLVSGKNQYLRESIKSALAFDARLLEKQANYLSNPDEDTSRNMFGIGKKYLGLSILLATFPGLPIYAHGQVEGYGERYAMDILKPQMVEEANQQLAAEHNRNIAPLLRRRDLFAGIKNFRFFDVFDKNGNTLEDVYCFINGDGTEKAMVLFNHSAKQVNGEIQQSAPTYLDNHTVNENVGEILNLASNSLLQFADFFSGEKIQSETKGIIRKGMTLSLGPYEAKVFWKFEQLGTVN